MCEKLGKHIDDLTVEKGLELLKKGNKKTERGGRELEEHVRCLAILKQQQQQQCDENNIDEPPKKTTKNSFQTNDVGIAN